MLVIDTSAIAKFALREDGWETLREYLKDGMRIPFAVVELGNVLWKRLLKNEIGNDAAVEILEDFSVYYSFLNENRHLVSALKISYGHRLSFYDSLFIATAAGEGCDLLTCDRKQAEIARRIGLKVIET